jgi:O-antigen biosynthesis protein
MAFWTDLNKTIKYARRNGLRETYYAAIERLCDKVGTSYTYEAPTLERLGEQRQQWIKRSEEGGFPLISFLVPLYQPNLCFLREMLESVEQQTYGNWELVLADGSDCEVASNLAASWKDERIHYWALGANGGISRNTNAAASHAKGDYVALLDYDDLLTPDAVFEITHKIERTEAEILYTDEDKCDASGKCFFEPNRKPEFNPDYLLTNNYICHLLVMKRELFLALGLRPEFDGAQDYDLILRAPWSGIVHIGKVLYHWRTHASSTAGNPGSKNYAYEAGKAALQEHFRVCHIDAAVSESRHNGFFRVEYRPDIFAQRPEVGVVGGKLLSRNRRIVGGMMDENGKVEFEGLHEMESGPMHRADTMQDAMAVDVRCMEIRDELRPLYQSIFNTAYDRHVMKQTGNLKDKSLEFCRQVRQQGYLIVWDPFMTKVLEETT